MGLTSSSHRRRRLRPAAEVTETPYEVKSIDVPRQAGPKMRFIAWLVEQPWAAVLLAGPWKASGIPAAVREVDVPEAPTYSPAWPPAPAAAPPAAGPAPTILHPPPPAGSSSSSTASSTSTPASEDVAYVAAAPGRVTAAVAGHTRPPGTPAAGGSANEVRRALARRGRPPRPGADAAACSAARPRTLAEYAAAYAVGAATPSQVAEAALAAIADSDGGPRPHLRAFIAVHPAAVRRAAAESARRFEAGAPLSPLDGIPFAVIDAVDAAGYDTTAGSAILAARRGGAAQGDAPAVAALKAAGAVLLGKANCHEAGVGMTGLNPIWGTPVNPHDTGRFAGGSSSGSAAAVAAGLAAFALGIDGGGSVRVPAGLCGIVGLRPTVGRTSTTGAADTAFSIMALGVLAPSAACAAAVHAAIGNAGTAGCVPRPPPLAVPAVLPLPGARPLAGTRVGVYRAWLADAAPGVVAACEWGLTALQEAGAELVDICLPELELVRCAQVVTIAAELAQAWKWALADGRARSRLTAETRVSLAQAARLSATDYLQALRIRTRLMTHVARLFGIGNSGGNSGASGPRGVCDLIAAPTCGVVAPRTDPAALRHGATDLRQAGELMRFTIPVNMAGLPAVSVPVGHGEGGLPVGLQLIGRPWDEAGLLAVAAALEAAATPRLRPPRLRWDLLAPRAAVQ